MIETPFGKLEIYMDNVQKKCLTRRLETSFRTFNVDGRICLDLGQLDNDSKIRISSSKTDLELYDKDSDEGFFIKMFSDNEGLILGIGINQDLSDMKIIEDKDCLINIVCKKDVADFKICLSWKKNLTDDSVWFACDPDYQ